ncbi:MAG: D-glycero-beta-D-manno-heptose 1-phosphate adenylyltransferase [Candidatus Pacearchaeota archaeon]|jgi:rfaE bifunctional protein nucleotidyltransferase chain/domain
MNKIKDLEQLKKDIENFKNSNPDKKVVWTNGCFDILHVGHIRYLQKAKACGDLLIVGINSDSSIREIKGPSRPIVSESERAELIAALECVDKVIIFSEAHPTKYLEELKPEVYAKGGDYNLDTINQDERKIVESYNGKIAILPAETNSSTTNIISKIKSESRC